MVLRRRRFLEEFLGALGAVQIHWREVSEDAVSGIVEYEHLPPDGDWDDWLQGFCWHMTEQNAPGERVRILAEMLHRKNLLHSDRIKLARPALREAYCEYTGEDINDGEFLMVLNELLGVVVRMIDDGRETDIYFIHE